MPVVFHLKDIPSLTFSLVTFASVHILPLIVILHETNQSGVREYASIANTKDRIKCPMRAIMKGYVK